MYQVEMDSNSEYTIYGGMLKSWTEKLVKSWLNMKWCKTFHNQIWQDLMYQIEMTPTAEFRIYGGVIIQNKCKNLLHSWPSFVDIWSDVKHKNTN